MFDRSIVSKSAAACQRSQELMSTSDKLCRDSLGLINASKEIVGDLDFFLSEFDDYHQDVANT